MLLVHFKLKCASCLHGKNKFHRFRCGTELLSCLSINKSHVQKILHYKLFSFKESVTAWLEPTFAKASKLATNFLSDSGHRPYGVSFIWLSSLLPVLVLKIKHNLCIFFGGSRKRILCLLAHCMDHKIKDINKTKLNLCRQNCHIPYIRTKCELCGISRKRFYENNHSGKDWVMN